MEFLKRASSYGIDLGNERAVVTVSRGQHCDFITTESGRTTPTIISFGEGKRMFGDIALHSQLQYIKETISNLKLLVGLNYNSDERQKLEERIQFDLCQMDDGSTGVTVEIDGTKRNFSPEQMIAYFLKCITKKGKNERINITFAVPANWNMEKRQRLSNAARIAGLDINGFVNTTTCAAVNYVISHKEKLPKTNEQPVLALFVDCGETMTTCTLARIKYGTVKVLATQTNNFVSGANFTDLFVNVLSHRVKEQFKVDIHKSKRTEYRFRNAVEKIKKQLSINSVALFELPSMSDDRDVKMNVERSEFSSAIQAYVDTLQHTFEALISMANVSIKDIQIIEAFGGTSRVPLIKQSIEKFFGKTPTQSMNADECIALGCGFLAQEGFPFILSDVNIFDIKAEWSQNGIKHEAELFKSGCPVPSTRELKMHIGGSKIVRILSNGENVGTLEVFTDSIESSDVSILLSLDSSSILNVQTSTVRAEFTPLPSIEEEEICSLIKQEEVMEERDNEEEKIDIAKNRFETAINASDSAISEAPDYIDYESIDAFKKLVLDSRLWYEMHEFDRLSSKEYDERSEKLERVANKALKMKQTYEDIQQRVQPYADRIERLLQKLEQEGSNDKRLLSDLKKEKEELHRYFEPNIRGELPKFDEQITKRKVNALENSCSLSKFGNIHLTKG